MGRGYMFEVTDNIDFIGNMDESDFYEDLSALSLDYVQNMSPEAQKERREELVNSLKAYGAHVQIVIDDTPEGFPDGVLTAFHLSDAFKKNYFHDRFVEMKSLASAITLAQFAIDSADTTLWKLKHAIEESYGDMIYFNGSWYTLDYFIRNADPKKTYFFGNVVLMH